MEADVLTASSSVDVQTTTLQAIEGATLTGFLAALGVLCLLEEADRTQQLGTPLLGWEVEPPFRAVLVWPGLVSGGDDLAQVLAKQMEAAKPDLRGRYKIIAPLANIKVLKSLNKVLKSSAVTL